ncbi:MAG: heavy metal translocating P-type ATPase [Planctomycetes bacterium]|nr:heavy metal translocating P-type ATPase [Planctomycetota bacterium]
MLPKSVRDIVCGMMINPSNAAASQQYKNETYYFCHTSCAKKFGANPESYLNTDMRLINTKPIVLTGDKLHYSCPMDPEIIKLSPGSCPKCGMPLEAMAGGNEESGTTNSELNKIYIAVALWLPLLGSHLRGFDSHYFLILQACLSSIIVFGLGLPILISFFKSIWPGPWNMFTLVGLGVIASHALSLLAVLNPELFGHHSYFESSAGIIVLMLIGQHLENRLHKQANNALSQMIMAIPKEARLVGPSGAETNIPIDLIQPGDLVRVRPGEKIPLDGIIATGNSSIDESMITGEPMPRDVESKDSVYAGTININGSFTLTTVHSGKETMLAKIIQMVEDAKRTKLPIQKIVDSISRIMVPFVLLVSSLTLIYWIMKNEGPQGWIDALQKSIAVLVIACPCALGLATPMAIGVGISRGAGLGILVRRGQHLENLIHINVLVIDKTGTLTEGKPSVSQIHPSTKINEQEFIKYAASLAQTSNHPLSKSIVSFALNKGVTLSSPTEIHEEAGQGTTGIVLGQNIILGKLTFLHKKGIPASNMELEEFANNESTKVWVGIKGTNVGFFELSDPIKPSSANAIKQLQNDGVKVILLSGDNEQSASKVAKQLDIQDFHGNKTPADKAEFIKALVLQGKKVGMAGDGTNDAPALALANVSIAMGTGTDLAQESSGIILLKGDLMAIVKARNLSKFTINAIKQNLALAFVYNLLSIPLASLGFLSPLLAGLTMSLSSISVLVNSLRLRKISI